MAQADGKLCGYCKENLCNTENDYKLFYHNTKQGRMRHDKVHNLFGYNMTRAAGAGKVQRKQPHGNQRAASRPSLHSGGAG